MWVNQASTCTATLRSKSLHRPPSHLCAVTLPAIFIELIRFFHFFFRLNCSLLPFCFRCYPRKQLGRGVEDLQLQSWLARFPPQIIPESLSCISLLFISFLSLCLSLFAINHIFRHLFNITSLHKFCLNFYTSLTFTSHLFSLDDLDWNPKLFQRKPGY